MFKLNRLISEYRIKVEHAICELKCYKVMGTRWRHPRTKLNNLVKICAGFVILRPSLYISCRSSARIRTMIHSHTLSVNVY
jgi:hypothetical protein